MSRYIFDNAAERPTAQRFSSLEALYDPRTIRFLERAGVGPGWRCLEVGGGGGSIAVWMAERVGAAGQVVVTDIDPRFIERLGALDRPNIAVQQHDIGADPLPEGAFDLIHARLVLIHVAARRQALARMAEALKPGGWLVVEDFDDLADRPSSIGDPELAATYRAIHEAQRQMMLARGFEFEWGRKLHRRFRALGLAEVGVEGTVTVWPGGSPGALLERANFEQIGAEAVASGRITPAQLDAALAAQDDPAFAVLSPVMFSAWGRRPA